MTTKRLAIAWLVLFALFYIVLSSIGCRTTLPATSRVPESACPQIRLVFVEGTGREEPTDSEHIGYAMKGCVKHYGPGACLIKLVKTGERSYQAICRRQGGSK